MSLQARKAVLKQFRDSGWDGPRVLIMSSVGVVGVNLDFACILIMVVCSFHLSLSYRT